ncbi:MAG: 3'-5' exonuclease [Halobacteriovoraceae bacterium]|jgi:DNA polymerase III subunit epsilon|nr:3'-5' exonuclease [Halobacteriovoraceae bacterium]
MDILKSAELIDELSFCVIDLETTGGNHNNDKIIEIGMVKIKQRKVVDEKSFLVNPEMPIPDFIQKLTNISQAKVKDAPNIEAIIDEVLEFIAEDIVVAHNTSFDVPFLNSVLDRLSRPRLENNVICTNVMTKHLIPEILNSNLNYMSQLFNIKHSKAHRAYDDALATAKLLIIFLDIFISKGIKKVNQLYYPRNKFELDRIHFNHKKHTNEDAISFIKNINVPTLVTAKGERGLILATIPLESPDSEYPIVAQLLPEIKWEMLTVRLIKPILEGFFQFNNHYFKYSEEVRLKTQDYLYNRYVKEGHKKENLEQMDFVISHHLVTDQVIVYSFLHLNTNHKHIFKIPAQKKKLYQYLLSQISKFETAQKGRRKHLIHSELCPLIESFLESKKSENQYLFLDRKFIKHNKEGTIEVIESFVQTGRNEFNFPTAHL